MIFNIIKEYAFDKFDYLSDDAGKEKKLSMFDQATIVASVPSRWLLNPSYMHTFGITENFFIIVEQPLSISFVKMTMSHLKQEPMMNSFKWYDNESVRIYRRLINQIKSLLN